MKLTAAELDEIWCALDRWEMLLRDHRRQRPQDAEDMNKRLRDTSNLKRRIMSLRCRSGAENFTVIEQ